MLFILKVIYFCKQCLNVINEYWNESLLLNEKYKLIDTRGRFFYYVITKGGSGEYTKWLHFDYNLQGGGNKEKITHKVNLWLNVEKNRSSQIWADITKFKLDITLHWTFCTLKRNQLHQYQTCASWKLPKCILFN